MDFKLPEIGEGVVEGEIVTWLVQPGQAIEPNDALVEVMTDKATIEVPSPIGGVMQEHRAAEGEICAVGAVIAVIDESGAAASAPAPAAPAPATAAAPAAPAAAPAPAAGGNGKVLATPAARAMAREHGIDLHAIPAERGRITKDDVIAAKSAPAPAPAPAATPAPAQPTPASARPAPAPVVRRATTAAEDEYIPFRGMRRMIAEQMSRSYATATHYTYVEQINVTKLVALRKDAKAAAAEQGVQLTYLPFLVKAICHALKKFPIVNAELDEANARIILRKRYNIGIATATENGLMVPVLHDADQLSLLDIARELARLSEAARTGKAARDELTASVYPVYRRCSRCDPVAGRPYGSRAAPRD